MSKRILLVLAIGILGFSQTSGVAYADTGPQLSGQKNPAWRSWHFVLRHVSVERANWMVDRAAEAGFNNVVVAITDGVRLDNAPWDPLPKAWSKNSFIAWVSYARSKGMNVVPEIKFLTHQEKLFQDRYPDLMFNQVTYDPRQDAVYETVFPLLDEVIEAMAPLAIHIGHDEVAGHSKRSAKKWLRPGENMLPAELFLKDVLLIHAYLKERGIDTWMWGDVLLSPSEFPTMPAKQLKGATEGYGKQLRDELPRDIVICDWHYTTDGTEFPSLSKMQNEGFRVLGAIFKHSETTNNFARYAAENNAYGMIATTWFFVQRREWDVVDEILRESGDVFLKNFPDDQ